MRPSNWLLTVLALIAAGGGLLIALNMTVDPYGLYHDDRGRRLAAYGDPRVAKYLLSVHYVPDNFNTILIGSSVSANWDMTRLDKLQVYNESINGGNIVEERAIVEQALSTPEISTALIIVQPYLTYSHQFETVKLEPTLRFSALGSETLVGAYKDMLRARLHSRNQVIDYAGTQRFANLPEQLNPTLRRLLRPVPPFDVDPIALAAYRDVIAQLRAHSV